MKSKQKKNYQVSIGQKNQRLWKWMLKTFLGVINADMRGLQGPPR